VNQADTQTTVSTTSPTVVGQTVTVTASVSAKSPGSGAPASGTITITGGGGCTITLPATTCTVTPTSAGNITFRATYNGEDPNFNATTGADRGTTSHTVNKADTTITITSDAPDPGAAITVVFTLTVDAPGSGTPTGTVSIGDGVDSCNAVLPATSCALTLTTSGARTLTANYPGDSNFNGDTDTEAHQVP
jgi:hypothetical protein